MQTLWRQIDFLILVDDTVQVIARSVVQPATDKDLENLLILNWTLIKNKLLLQFHRLS